MIATGEFSVDLQPLDAFTQGIDGISLNRLSINKTFTGDLTAKSVGEMISAATNVQGSAGYVAIEQVQGTLHGKRGSFVLQHFGISHRGQQRLVLEIVPDSGAGQLENITGSMTIKIEGGRHFYEFDYNLP